MTMKNTLDVYLFIKLKHDQPHGSFKEHHCSIAAEIAKFLSRLVWN
jgi:hypothetical protein